ncbi:MAG TPA: hypothetical protein VHZ07_06900 [Bryobacteraceae bacterium]|nr:hypothetical protein [Bryobacteraceae bacterium]
MEEELEEEMRLHTDLRGRQLRKQGMDSADADAVARLRFGNRTLIKEASREIWTLISIETLWRELKLAARTLRLYPAWC